MNRLMIGPDYDQERERLKLRFETADVGDPLFILSPGLRVKRFPNCASAHRSMEALLELRTRHGFGASEVEQLIVRAPQRQFNNLMFTAPENGLEAKFSMEFALAVLLLEGDLRLDHFRQDFVMNADLRGLYPKIVRQPVDEEPGRTRGEVEVELKDGRRLSACVFEPAGSPAAPFGWEDYWRKFDTCVAGQLAPEAVADLRHALERLPELESVDPLMKPLRSLSP
jgi:2-methylcitrate dehydratase PrpD